MAQFKRKRLLTRPVLKLIQDQSVHVKVEAPMFEGKDIDKDKPEGTAKKKPATLLNVVNLEDGTQAQIVVPAVLHSVLDEAYPNNGYVGLCFTITKRGKQAGKQYNPCDVEEIEDPATSEQPTESEAPPARQRRSAA